MTITGSQPDLLGEEGTLVLLASIADSRTGGIGDTGAIVESKFPESRLAGRCSGLVEAGCEQLRMYVYIVRFPSEDDLSRAVSAIGAEGTRWVMPGSELPSYRGGLRLFQPSSLKAALRRLGPPERRPGLPPASEVKRQIAWAVADEEIPEAVFERLVQDENYLSDYEQKHDREAARRWFDRRWSEMRALEADPPISSVGEAVAHIRSLRQAVERGDWDGRNGIRDRRVADAVLSKAEDLHAVRFHMGDREGARRAGVASLRTYQRGRTALIAMGWFKYQGEPGKWVSGPEGKAVRRAGWYRLASSPPIQPSDRQASIWSE